MKTCCVIGGGGFIGQHIVKELVSRKRKIVIIDKAPVVSETIQKYVRYVVGDYEDKKLLHEVLETAEEVIILAYSSVPKTSFDDPVKDIFDNLPAFVHLLQIASELNIEKIVMVSSGGTVYGEPIELPICEDHPTNPISPYGITKLATEKYAFMYNKLKGLPVVCVRPGNAYGEGQRPFTGQGFIANVIASIMLEKQISILGENGTIRDYIHVSDMANGIIAALMYGKPNSCYNVGTGVGRSTLDILNMLSPLASSVGLNPKIKVLSQRPFDVNANILDCTKIFNETGWRSTISLEEGIKRTWQWFTSLYLNKKS